MAIVIHDIGKNQYAYDHFRVGPTVKSKYLGPVDGKGRIRGVYKGDGVERAPIGTTTASLREIYNKAVRRKALEEGKTVAPVHREKPYEPPAKKVEKRVVTAKRVGMPKPTVEKKEVKPEKGIVKPVFVKEDEKSIDMEYEEPFKNSEEGWDLAGKIEQHDTKTKFILVKYIDEEGREISDTKTILSKKRESEIAEEKKEEKSNKDLYLKETTPKKGKVSELTKKDYEEARKASASQPRYFDEVDKMVRTMHKEGYNYTEEKKRMFGKDSPYGKYDEDINKEGFEVLVVNEIFFDGTEVRKKPLSREEAVNNLDRKQLLQFSSKFGEEIAERKTKTKPVKKEPGVKTLTAKEVEANLKELKAEGRSKRDMDMIIKANPDMFSTGVPKKEPKKKEKKEEKPLYSDAEMEKMRKETIAIRKRMEKEAKKPGKPFTKKEDAALKKKYGTIPKYPIKGTEEYGRRMTRAEIKSTAEDYKEEGKPHVESTNIWYHELNKLYRQARLDNLGWGRGQEDIAENRELFVENRIQRHQFYSNAGNVRTKPFTREKAEKAAKEEIEQIRTFTPWDNMTKDQQDKYFEELEKKRHGE